jgi:hypothetical protein
MSIEQKIEESTQAITRLIEALENKKASIDAEQSTSASNNASRDDAQKALVRLSKEHGKNPAKAILAKFDATKIGDLNEADYRLVVNAVDKYSPQEAA